MASLSRAERETVIRWDMEEREVSVYSCLPGAWKRCERAGWTLAESVKDSDGREIAREYRGPLSLFGWRATSVNARQVRSERMKRQMAERKVS